MSDLPKCKLCGCEPHRNPDGKLGHKRGSRCKLVSAVYFNDEEWRTLMTQQAEPSQVPTGHVYLPEITPEMWETLGDTDVMTWIDGPQWTQIAVDFASMLPVKMPAQHPDKDRIRYKSACEISGDKHPEYVRGYEAAIDAVCMTKQAGEPVAWEFQHEDTGLIDFVDPQQVEWGFEKNNPRWQKIGPVYRWHAQAQPDGEIVVTWDESQTRIIAVTRQDAEGKVLSVIAEAQPAPIPTAWQPIETAPKDGTVILGLNDDDGISEPVYFSKRDYWCSAKYYPSIINDEITGYDLNILHWQPLQPAPGGEG